MTAPIATDPRAVLLDLLGRGAIPPQDLEPAVLSAPPTLRPWLHWRLEAAGALGRLSATTAAKLTAERRAAALVHLQRRATLKRIVAALDRGRVPVIVVKGMALAYLVYPDPALRPMSDIDLWVQPQHLPQADAALHAAGLAYPARTHRGLQLPTAAEATTERSFEVPGTPVLVELHGALKSLAALPPSRVALCWDRSQPSTLGGIPVRTLHPEDLLLHLCLHAGSQHRYTLGLGPLLDVQRVVARWREKIAWEAAAADWRRSNAATWMVLTLTLARELLGARIPDRALAHLPPPAMWSELRTLAMEQIWSPGSQLPPAWEQLTRAGALSARARWLGHRLAAYLDGTAPAPWWRRIWTAAGRIGHDLAVKAPRYVRLWLRGQIRGAQRAERSALAQRRARLGVLVAEADGAAGSRP